MRGAARPSAASYPGPAEGCRLLRSCRANIRGRGKRPVSPSHHETPQPDRWNRGGLFAASGLGFPPNTHTPRSYFSTTTCSSPNSALPTPALSSCLCLSFSIFCSRECPSHRALMCLHGSATRSGLPILAGSLLPWHYSPVPLAVPLLWSPNPSSLPSTLPPFALRSLSLAASPPR